MSKFLGIFRGEKYKTPPLWFMRQAGRSLPEYREIRKRCRTFLDMCYTPSLVAEVTLQPVIRFGLDAAILFSDILVIPDALGQPVYFKEGEGPHLFTFPLQSFRKKLSLENFVENLSPIYEAAGLVKKSEYPLIGFAGAPWTLALYMLEGRGSRGFEKAKKLAFEEEEVFLDFLTFLEEAIVLHLTEQIRAGVDAIQLFDTCAFCCPATHFQKWIFDPALRIAKRLKEAFPTVPLISFPKGIGENISHYAQAPAFSGLSLDFTLSPAWVTKIVPENMILQGNLDPVLLCVGGDPLKRGIETIHREMGGHSYIFNLGHGVLPDTPLRNISDCVNWVRSLDE